MPFIKKHSSFKVMANLNATTFIIYQKIQKKKNTMKLYNNDKLKYKYYI